MDDKTTPIVPNNPAAIGVPKIPELGTTIPYCNESIWLGSQCLNKNLDSMSREICIPNEIKKISQR